MENSITLYAQLGQTGSPMQTVELEHKETIAPLNYSRSGYGNRLPTPYMVRLPESKVWRRVYAICYSNCASYYFKLAGARVFVNECGY